MSRAPFALALVVLATSCAGDSSPPPSSANEQLPEGIVPNQEGPTAEACASMARDVAALVGSLATDPAGTPRPAASNLDAEIYGHLEMTPVEAKAAQLQLYEGIMITCDSGLELEGDLAQDDRRWRTITEQLPAAIQGCDCMLKNDALLGWLWVTAQLWPPDYPPPATSDDAPEAPPPSEVPPPVEDPGSTSPVHGQGARNGL